MKIEFLADDVVTMKDTTEDGKNIIRRWIKCSVNIINYLIELVDWRDVNPRNVNPKCPPVKSMKNTLSLDYRDIFHLLNRGLCISAKKCSVENVKDKKRITLELTDKQVHGLYDGAHSFFTILESVNDNSIYGEKHMLIEVVTGVEDILTDLARARNTSSKVHEKSFSNLEGKFDFIKDSLKDEDFYNSISFKDNDGELNVTYLIQILTTFNNKLSDRTIKTAYSTSSRCEEIYIKEFNANLDNEQKENVYYKLSPLYKDIFKFVDYVNINMPIIYNRNGYAAERGIFGKLKGIVYKPDGINLFFTEQTTNYKIPNSFIFPILAGMRCLYRENNDGMYEWIINPFKAFDDNSEFLITKVMGTYFDCGSSANELGKKLTLWTDCHKCIEDYLRIKELEARLAAATAII